MTVFTAHIEGVDEVKDRCKIFKTEESAYDYLETIANKYVEGHDDMDVVEAAGVIFVVWKLDKTLVGRAYFRHLSTHAIYKMYVTEDHVYQ